MTFDEWKHKSSAAHADVGWPQPTPQAWELAAAAFHSARHAATKAERERCAEIAETLYNGSQWTPFDITPKRLSDEIAKKIRGNNDV